ncbi:hypothetical protein SUNI508_13613 [Seiridium unicorne]|uniref:Uncharacterized protein n=1 Tax=Seiridium unicorne TaxID=138068 RepID=A0ABR2VBX6_9PEZI
MSYNRKKKKKKKKKNLLAVGNLVLVEPSHADAQAVLDRLVCVQPSLGPFSMCCHDPRVAD